MYSDYSRDQKGHNPWDMPHQMLEQMLQRKFDQDVCAVTTSRAWSSPARPVTGWFGPGQRGLVRAIRTPRR
jgi:hypothetical protein